MNKFLRLVEENRPGEDRYTVELKDVNGELIDSFEMWGTGSPFENFDTFKKEFGSPIPVEDGETSARDVKTITAIAGLPDQGMGKMAMSTTARKLNRAKKTMASAAEVIAKNFKKAAESSS